MLGVGVETDGGSLQWEGRSLRTPCSPRFTDGAPASAGPGPIVFPLPGPWPGGGWDAVEMGGQVQLWGPGCWRQQEPPSLLAKQSQHKICKWYNYCYLFC